jgi:hypothetical protein
MTAYPIERDVFRCSTVFNDKLDVASAASEATSS